LQLRPEATAEREVREVAGFDEADVVRVCLPARLVGEPED
jgi:hypothetical protein